MEIKIKDVVALLDVTFRPELQESYDNAGFLVGDGEQDYRGALVALDVTSEVIDEAIRYGVNLIVTHHPLIFGSLKRINAGTAIGDMLIRLIRHGISVYAAHTNLDNLAEGVNGVLAQRLGLTDTNILRPIKGEEGVGAGMVGMLREAITFDEWIAFTKEVLGIGTIRCSLPCRERVKRVAICGGAGAFLIDDAIRAGADIYMTSDLKYHDFQRAEGRIVIADIGHYESEQFAKDIIYNVLYKNFSKFACQISDSKNSYIRYF